VKIADGDTITVRRGSREKIRFCGVDAVEAEKVRTTGRRLLRSLIGLGDGTVLVTPIEKDRYEEQ